MKIITNWVFVVILSCFFCLQTYSQTEVAKVDSVYNLISGNWYKVIDCHGMTGRCDSVSSDYLNKIERIVGTDSITWEISLNDTIVTTKKYKISYSLSNLHHINKWMLTGRGFDLSIETIPNGFMCGVEAYDGGGIGYSRIKSITGIVVRPINHTSLSLFPNPTTRSFVVTGLDYIEHIHVLDANGRLLQSKDCCEPIVSIDISDLPKGIYFVRAFSKGGIRTGKIIKNE